MKTKVEQCVFNFKLLELPTCFRKDFLEWLSVLETQNNVWEIPNRWHQLNGRDGCYIPSFIIMQ